MRSAYLAGAAVLLLCVFAVAVIVAWSPVVPEAVAVDVAHQAQRADFGIYIALHESWHAGTAPGHDMVCAR